MKEKRSRGRAHVGLFALSVFMFGQPVLAAVDSAGDTLVDCAKAGSGIQRSIDKAASGKPIVIVIKGTCTEAVTVTRDDLTLKAHAGGGTINGSITVIGGQRITVDRLKVTGNGDGVTALDNAYVNINNAVLEENNGSGVSAGRSALVVLRGNTIRMNGDYGVLVSDGANVQILADNTIESSVADLNDGSAIGGYRHATIRVRDGGNTIINTERNTPDDPLNLGTFKGFAVDVEHLSVFRQDSGHALIIGHIYVFNLTTADFREMEYLGHIFVDGLNANFRVRNSSVNGGMTMFGPADVRSDVTFAGDVYCNFQFLNPDIPTTGSRNDCFP